MIISAKTLFPSKVSFTDPGGEDVHTFGGNAVQFTVFARGDTAGSSQILSVPFLRQTVLASRRPVPVTWPFGQLFSGTTDLGPFPIFTA